MRASLPQSLACNRQPACHRASFRSSRHSVVKVFASVASWRPTMDDVERLSRGDSARVRGTGSRFIPHRLNTDERTLYDQAKKKGYLSVHGSGYRKERKGFPLANIWRQWCDARGLPCVVVQKGGGSSASQDVVLVDLATLRQEDVSRATEEVLLAAEACGAAPLTPALSNAVMLPFNIIPLEGDAEPAEEEDQEPEGAAPSAALSVEGGVEAGAQLASASWRNGRVKTAKFAPTWRLLCQPIMFEADRAAAKAVAKSVYEALTRVS